MMFLRSVLAFTLILSCLIWPALLFAQTHIQPEHLTIKDGLSQGFISCMLQDSEGFLWIGTKNGLNRYDGEHFKVFTHDPADPYSISGDFISGLYEIGDYLLVGTESAGLNIFHKRSQRFYKIPQKDPSMSYWTTTGVRHIFKDALDQVWIVVGASHMLVRLRFPENFWEVLPMKEQILQEIEVLEVRDFGNTSIVDGGEGYLIGFTYPDDMFKINCRTGEWEFLGKLSLNDNMPGLPFVQGNWLLHHGNNIGLLKESKWRFFKTEGAVYVAYFEKEDELCINNGKELLLFDLDFINEKMLDRSNAHAIIPITKTGVKSVIKDRSGVIWAATPGYGLLKVSPRQLKVKNYFKDNSISYRPFATGKGEILVGSPVSGIMHIPGENPHKIHPSILSLLYPSMWSEQNDGSLWLVYKSDDHERMRGNIHINQILENGQGIQKASFPCNAFESFTISQHEKDAIWMALPTGKLLRFDPATNDFQSHDFSSLFSTIFDCYDMAKTANGHWWIGTSKGLVHAFPKRNGKEGPVPSRVEGEAEGHVLSEQSESNGFEFELLQTKEGELDGLLSNDVASLLIDPDDPNILWLGTKGSGLHRLDTRNMTFTHLTSRQGLPNDVIYSVLNDDKGNLWMSSNKGIIKYNPGTGDIRNYTKADGMQGDEFNTWAYAKSPSGEMIFGGINGLNVFHPDDLKENPVVPNVWITGLEVNNARATNGDSTRILQESIEYTSEISLPFSKNNITLEFAALEFSAPLKNRFRYYLEGAEAPWTHESTDNRAPYLNLSPGDYTFKIKAANNDGIWNEQAKELKITILPPWYRSNLAYLIYALLIGLAIWQFRRFERNRIQLRHTAEMEQKEAERLKELDQAKSRLYTNITHEFRTPLTVISGIAKQMKPNTLADDKILIERNSDQLLNLVNQMLDLRKLESGTVSIKKTQGDIVKFIRYLTESLKSYAEMKALTIHFLSNEKSLLMDFDSEKMTRIHSNLLSNAIKFTDEGGNIYIQLHIENKDGDKILVMTVRDTGLGISKDKLPHIFDRFYQVDDSSTRKGEGTGIGLTLVSELIKAMNGKIEVTSTEGEGTTFVINLPITNSAEMESESSVWKISNASMINVATASPNLEKSVQSNPEDSSKPMILIVEDNADVIHYLIKCLKDQYTIEIAMNGQEGIEKAIEHVPDIIVSDIMMPIKDGLELCQTLKTDERTSHIPITLLTAKADIDSRLEGLERGADAYLSKPFHQEELLITLQKQLELRKKLHARFSQLSDHLLPKNIPATEGEFPLEIDLDLEDAFLKKIRALVEKDLSDADFGITQLCRGIGMSRSQVHNKIKALTGISTSIYIRSIRLNQAKKLLHNSDFNVSEVAYAAGFKDPNYFSRLFIEEFGYAPSKTRK